jgi:cation:H+ antiporter
VSWLSPLLVLLGAGLLYLGGEALIRGAVDLSRLLGLTPMVIGLTVVAFATSAPELAASLTASLRGSPDVAIGNVLGSNVANVGLILALAAFFGALQAQSRFVRREMPIMLAATLLLLPMLLDLRLGRLEGLILLAALALYIGWCLRAGRVEPPELEGEVAELIGKPPMRLSLAILAVAAGIALLVLGAWALVEGAVDIARHFGVPERVIGLTMVAFGTSLPELAAAVAAARKRQADLVLGNVVGSNIFNVLGILGATALVRPLPVAVASLRVDYWVALGFSVVVLPLLWPDLRLGRLEGSGLLLLYAAYLWLLFA